MDSSDESVDGRVYQTHEITAHGFYGKERVIRQQEKVDMFIPARMGVTASRKEKVSLHGGSFGSQGGTLEWLLANRSCRKC
jgi:hypothetical protein